MLRLCACLQIPAHIIAPAGFPTSDRAFRRAGLDYVDLVAITRHDSYGKFRSWQKGNERRLLLLTTGGHTALHDYRFQAGDVIMVGRESAGVPDEVHADADARLVIPMAADARSLNVAVSAAMAVHEAVRQLDAFPAQQDAG